MNGWRVIFEHRFPDSRFSNFRSSSGKLDQNSNFPTIAPSPQGDRQTMNFAKYDGQLRQWAALIYDQPITDVIGVVFTCVARVPQAALGDSGSIFSAGEPINSEWGLRISNKHFNIMFKGEQTIADTFTVMPHQWYEIRWIWGTNGQSELYINGTLEAYRNNVHPGQTIVIDRCWIGSASVNYPPEAGHFFTGDVRYLRLQIIRPKDTMATIGSLMPYDPKDLAKLKACQDAIIARQQLIRDTYAEFMRSFVVSETKPSWRRDTSSPHSLPYSPKAIAVHRLSMEVGNLTLKYIRDANDKALPPLLKAVKEMLMILAKWNPEKYCETFDNLHEKMEKIPISDKCKKIAAALREKYSNIEPFNRTTILSSEIYEIMQRIRAEVE